MRAAGGGLIAGASVRPGGGGGDAGAREAVGLIGCGTVGSGVVRLWNESGYAQGATLKTVAVRDRHKPRPVDLSAVGLIDDAWAIVRDPEIRLVIEATGDTELAHGLALACFEAGKSFVTAGKSLVARFGPELEERAQRAGVAFLYEAAVCGVLPVVGLLRQGLSPGAIRGFEGVLNGTCNFILARLGDGLSFPAALALAQARGFAEADSRRDTSGLDAAEKLVILASLCGVRLDPEAVPRHGIENLRPDDVLFGRRRGWSLRLIASFGQTPAGPIAGVAPTFVPEGSILAQARDEENVVVLDGGPAGKVSLVGRGAGSLPTAAAVLSDVRQALAGVAPRGAASPRGGLAAPGAPSGREVVLREGVRILVHREIALEEEEGRRLAGG
jgi:homoserine dehydrogenase